MGVGIMAMGTFIALLPERAFAFATQTVPSGAATTTTLLVLLLVGGMTTGLRAQHVAGQTVVVVPRSPQEKDLQHQIVCMCGTCGRQRISECTCSTAEGMRAELASLVAKGMTNDQVIEYFVKKYGSQEVLASPIDAGFNRLAYLVPYGVGALGVVTIGSLAVRWSRRRAETAAPHAGESAPTDAGLESKLDDELRDLD